MRYSRVIPIDVRDEMWQTFALFCLGLLAQVSLCTTVPKGADAVFYSKVEKDNKAAFDLLSRLMTSKKGWTHVATTTGVTVERRILAPGPFVDKADAAKAGKHACVKSTGMMNCEAEKVFRMFMDRSRVGEYNEHVSELRDVHFFPKKSSDHFTKITWACGPKYGPFKPRDFLSVVHFQKYANGTYVILNRPAYHSEWKPSAKYVRATVLLAGNVIEPRGSGRCYMTQVAHINPGGVADTPAVAWVINKLCATGPPAFFRKLEKAVQRTSRTTWSLPPLSLPLPPTFNVEGMKVKMLSAFKDRKRRLPAWLPLSL